MRVFVLLIVMLCLAILPAGSQSELGTYEIFVTDPIKVCPKRYKLDFENESVRVIRAKLAPNDEGILCEFEPYLMVFLSEARVRIEADDWDTVEIRRKSGQTQWVRGGWQRIQNQSDKTLECLIVQPKSDSSSPLSALVAPGRGQNRFAKP